MNIEEILATEVSEDFIRGMRDRMVMSFHKYGAVADAYPVKIDAIASALKRIQVYRFGDPEQGIEKGNTEYLMDAANFMMIEFMRPAHPDAHFKSTDDDGSPGRARARTKTLTKQTNYDI